MAIEEEKTMKISNRVQKIQFSAIRKLTPYAQEAKKNGKKVYHLNIGAPDVEVPQAFFDAIGDFQGKVLKYPSAPGIDELRESWSNYYKKRNLNFEPENIFITSGASEALLLVLMTIADEGDEIITTNPFYSNYKTYMDQLNLKINAFNTSPDNGFALPSTEEIEKVISDKSVAFLISNPTNPTGAVYSRDELERLKELAIKHDMYIITDEVYREFIYDGLKYLSFAELEGIDDRLILLDSISKRFGACGARIGAIAAKNKDILTSINKLATGRLAVPTLEQIGAAALFNSDESYFEEVNKEYEKRRNTIYEELKKIDGVSVYKPKGAFYIMPTLPVDDAEDFAKWLLTDFDVDGETLMMAPADGFFYNSNEGKNKVRLAFVLNVNDIKKAMNILKEGLRKYNS
jgi:hypothetical protein